jgi:hypothetical protein
VRRAVVVPLTSLLLPSSRFANLQKSYQRGCEFWSAIVHFLSSN